MTAARLSPLTLVAASTTLAILVGITGCSAVEPHGDAGTWTVLTYEIADTDLEPFMMTDVGEMAEVGSDSDLSIVSLVDRADGYSNKPVVGLDNWVGGKLLKITDGGADVLDDMGDIDTGDPQVLADFIARGIADYPADHYSLIISDHGASWPGVGGDESADDDSLTLDEISSGISDGLAAAGVDKLDLLGFDACLMATYEVASALAPLADRMLASQELEPGHGWDYSGLRAAAEGATADELGASLIKSFKAQAKTEDDAAEITLSLIDLTRMPEVDDAVSAFSKQLVDRVAGVSPAVGRTLASTLGFGSSPDPAENSFMTDLGMFAGTVSVDALDVADAADEVVRAVNDAVVDKVDGQATRGATGLSIYFPPTVGNFDDDYRALGGNGGWMDFLSAYYGEGAAIPAGAQAQFAHGDTTTSFDSDGVTISGTFSAAAADNISSAYIRYGIVQDDGTVSYTGEEPADLSDDGSGLVSATYDLTNLTITDGEDTTTAYLGLTTAEDGSTVTFDVPMAYYAPDDADGTDPQDSLLSLTLDGDTGDLTDEIYYSYDASTGNYGELSVEDDGIIVPEVLSVAADGTQQWVGTLDSGLYADLSTLDYDLADVPSGTTMVLELWAVDFGGNSDMVSTTITVP